MKKFYYILLCMAFVMSTSCLILAKTSYWDSIRTTTRNRQAHSGDDDDSTETTVSYSYSNFKIAQTNQDNSGLWITCNINGITYVLANVSAADVQGEGQVVNNVVYLDTISTFLNNSHNVSVYHWTNGGVIFGIQSMGSDAYMILQGGGTNAIQKLYGLTNAISNTAVNWNGSFISFVKTSSGDSTSYTFKSGAAEVFTLNQPIQYIAGNPIFASGLQPHPFFSQCTGGSLINAPYNYRISPTIIHKIGVGSNGKTDNLWLNISLTQATSNKAISYALAKNANAGNAPANFIPGTDAQALKIALNTLTDADWKGGIYFSFVESCGQVSLYVQNAAGKPLGEVIIPGITNFMDISNSIISFGGSNITKAIKITPLETLCLTNGDVTLGRNLYVRVPSNVKDTTFTAGSLSSVVRHKFGLSNTSNLWLNMIVNGTSYTLARGSGVPAGSNAPALATPTFPNPITPLKILTNPATTPSTPADITNVAAYLESISIKRWNAGVYFNFVKLNNHVYLNIQEVGQAPSTSKAFLLPGVTNISGNVLFGGSDIPQAISISPYQTLGLMASGDTGSSNSSIGPCYQFSNATSVEATTTSPIVCSYYESIPTLSITSKSPKTVNVKGGKFNNSGLWLNMNLNSKNYVLVWTLSQAITSNYATSGKVLDQTLNNALAGLQQTDWNNGIIFSFQEANGIVSLNVSKTNGTFVGSVVIPGITKISDIQGNVTFGGSNMPDATPVNPSSEAFGLTTQNPLPGTVVI
ncbi:MAG TPA: hypothetical protein VLG50_04215 [Candidatus Saccharimonadales bacterium]|nr:hypothetical protein [Candidatus Saccharimonadales bacterium]